MATNAFPHPECTETAEKMLPNKKQPSVTTLSVKLVKNSKKQMHIMQIHAVQQVNFADWKRARLQRENNSSLYAHHIIDKPKFGGGSTYGRVARAEARNRRLTRKYKPENQPWILTTNYSDDKKHDKDKTFKGTRAGGVGKHSNYYIFVQNADGKSLSAYPIQDWYHFHPSSRYKTLSIDEAEEEYMRRDQQLNFFSLMMQKRLRSGEENKDPKLQANAATTSIEDLKISEMDDWISSNEDDNDSDAENKQSNNEKDKKKKKKANRKKKKESDNEAFEESDDGDKESRECEYITDSSASESELEQQKEEGSKSVAEETGLKNLLSSDSESHEDENEGESNDECKVHKGKHRPDKEKPACGADKSVNLQGTKKENKSAGSNLLSATKDGTDKAKIQKRTMSVSSDEVQIKRFKLASAFFESSYISEARESGISIETVSKYLKRKPMTLVDLLKKFKIKKKGLKKEDVGRILIPTLEKIKPNKKQINDSDVFWKIQDRPTIKSYSYLPKTKRNITRTL